MRLPNTSGQRRTRTEPEGMKPGKRGKAQREETARRGQREGPEKGTLQGGPVSLARCPVKRGKACRVGPHNGRFSVTLMRWRAEREWRVQEPEDADGGKNEGSEKGTAGQV